MAEIAAAWRRGFFRLRRISGAACARSENLTLPVWAPRPYSPLTAQRSAQKTRTTAPRKRLLKLKGLAHFADYRFRPAPIAALAALAFGGCEPSITDAALCMNGRLRTVPVVTVSSTSDFRLSHQPIPKCPRFWPQIRLREQIVCQWSVFLGIEFFKDA